MDDSLRREETRSGTLVLLSSSFPYGVGETFLAEEFPYLVRAFDEIHIFPYYHAECTPRVNEIKKMEGVYVHPPMIDLTSLIRAGGKCLFGFPRAAPLFLKDFTASGTLSTRSGFVMWSRSMVGLSIARASGSWKKLRSLVRGGKSLVYSYWAVGPAYLGIFLKAEEQLLRLAVRAHGGDLYGRDTSGYIPLQRQVVKYADLFCCISHNGADFIQGKYPDLAGNVAVCHLGTHPSDPSPVKKEARGLPTVVTCSSFAPVKRLTLIADSLVKVDLPLRWVHFGGADHEAETIISRLKGGKVQADFKGVVPNAEIRLYYEQNEIDVFVNLSSSEGLPVSIIEAAAAAIPVVATNVGGTGELIDDGCGRLLSANPSSDDAAKAIRQLLNATDRNISQRTEINKRWRNGFDATVAYEKFISVLKGDSNVGLLADS